MLDGVFSKISIVTISWSDSTLDAVFEQEHALPSKRINSSVERVAEYERQLCLLSLLLLAW